MQDDKATDPVNAYFLGPKSENEAFVRAEIQSILDRWFGWRKSLFPDDPAAISREDRLAVPFLKAREELAQHLDTLNDLLADEIPKYSPRYLGHMVSELALPAIFGHFAALLHNPNNLSKEASRVGTQLEADVVSMMAAMIGYDPEKANGHITGGGTVANFEASWRARFTHIWAGRNFMNSSQPTMSILQSCPNTALLPATPLAWVPRCRRHSVLTISGQSFWYPRTNITHGQRVSVSSASGKKTSGLYHSMQRGLSTRMRSPH